MDAPIDTSPELGQRRPGGRGDLTTGPVLKTLLAFSAPTLASNVLQSLNGSVNSMWVGRLLGDEALAATANANVVMFLIFAAVFGFGMAATVRVGHSFGAGRVDAARRTFGTALGFCGLLSIAVAVAGYLLTPTLLTALHTPGKAYGLALAYLQVSFIAMPAMTLSIMLATGLRGSGDARTPLMFMLLTVGLDIVLNPLLISGAGPFPRMGIAGSATSTVLASTVGMLGTAAYIYAKDLALRLRGAELGYLRPRMDEMAYIVTKGLPMGFQMFLMSASGIIMVGLVNREGILVAAAYGAAMQLWTYLQMPAMAIGAAVSAMAAQAIGARLPGRIAEITRAGLAANLLLTGILTALMMTFDKPALALFLGPDSPAVPIARHIQLLASWSFILFGVTIVLFGSMRAGGVVIQPLVVLAVAFYPARLGFIHFATPALGQNALWWAFPFGSAVAAALAAVSYRFTGWRKHIVPVEQDLAVEESLAGGDSTGRMNPAI